MKLKLGFSTCPNDTFIFDALVHKRIDTQGLDFELVLADVEELNKMAFNQQLDITKISFHAYAYIAQNYLILNSGSALGRNNGPLLVAKKSFSLDEVPNLKIAIPGKNTTANLILHYAFPNVENTVEYLFSDIMPAVLNDHADAGLIIHESRFTYQNLGLKKIIDLGEFWEQKTAKPVPLGGIIIHRRINPQIQKLVDKLIRQSIEYAYKNPADSLAFIRKYAQEMDSDVMRKHIELYVNDFTLDLTQQGRDAVRFLLNKAVELNFVNKIPDELFV